MRILDPIKIMVARISRAKKLNHFYSYFKEGMTVLDAGVYSESKKNLQTTNMFLREFRYSSKYYTGLGIQNLNGMDKLFPGKRFVQYPGGQFPFNDKEFDWVFSNAVIEHVGDNAAQLYFLNEMLRVGKNIFFTTPNKYFPVESHTNLLFLHWNDKIFYYWCDKFRHGVSKETLYLFSNSRLRKLVDISNASSCKIVRNCFFGLSMTFTVVCSE